MSAIFTVLTCCCTENILQMKMDRSKGLNYFPLNVLTNWGNSMDQSCTWKTESWSDYQEIPCPLKKLMIHDNDVVFQHPVVLHQSSFSNIIAVLTYNNAIVPLSPYTTTCFGLLWGHLQVGTVWIVHCYTVMRWAACRLLCHSQQNLSQCP
jgi:hypothetical protein